MQSKVLVIGGTGMLGRPVAEQLRRDGFKVTVMSTDAARAKSLFGGSIPVLQGDVTDPQSLERTIERFDIVYLNLNSHLNPDEYRRLEIDGTANVAAVARRSGVKRLSMISSATSLGVEEGPIYVTAKVLAERAVMDSGVPYSIMRPSWFYETLPRFIRGEKAGIIGQQPHPLGWLAAADFARQVSRALTIEEAAGMCFYNVGPTPMTIKEALSRYCAVIHPGIKPQTIPFSTAKLLSLAPGMSELRPAIPFFKFFNDYREEVDAKSTDRLLGPNTTTLDEWLEIKEAAAES